ncbi:hypothetical protein HHK36_016940 [Tetracentron sinense]|uniref:VQ domain-containing protein n=1 Tax=Tetracentron sinense TaxID=13715 RepID=A0A835DF64_TETSI|nr:hypothetical protein HHK36_016940 [Tetracentron sinense]
MLADYLGNLARDGHLFRLDVPSWLHIDKDRKQRALELVRIKFDIEPFAKKFILASFGHKYRDWKEKQRRENVIPGATSEQLLAACPADVIQGVTILSHQNLKLYPHIIVEKGEAIDTSLYMPSFDMNMKRVFPKRELQGPRPPPLKVDKNSSKIKKPLLNRNHRSPVVIYLRSPEIIHTRPQDFMNLVQRLTGKGSSVVSATSSFLLPSSSVVEYKADETNSKKEFVKGQEKDDSKVDLVILSPGLPSNPSPLSPSFFLPSPIKFTDWPWV